MGTRLGVALGALGLTSLVACASLVSNAASGLASSLTSAMLNQDDPAVVRDGAPAFLLLLDGMVEDAPRDVDLLRAASELYAAYGVVFVDDAQRARTLTSRARAYGRRALCASNAGSCDAWNLPYEEFVLALEHTKRADVPALYSFALSWLAFVRAHRDDWAALAQLPQVRTSFERLQHLDEGYKQAKTEHYLAVLNTIRPPSLGGDFEAGQSHFLRALELSNGHDLGVKVDYAKYYARTLYDRELHDRLLTEVLEADPYHEGFVLSNVLAKDEAAALLQSADEYF